MPPQQNNECPFCQLISNPDQLKVVEETENFYAWLEVNPRAKGHTMVVPKEHKDSIMDFNPEEYKEGMFLARKVVEKAEKGLNADGASITINIDEVGGQMFPHAYIQVFPRFEDEENAGTPTGAIFPQKDDIKDQLDSIKDKMSNVESNFEKEEIEPHPASQKFKETEKKEDEEEKKEEKQEKDNSKQGYEGKSYSWQ
ncbi:MAG: HIT family protein [Candidatus Nanohaloarchaea archaeon]